MRTFILALMLLLAAPAWATTYYMSPTGDNANNGLSTGAPKKTFAHTLALLADDDIVILMDGTWDGTGGTDLPSIVGAGYDSGSAGHPITIRAQNERQAIINGKGTAQTFTITSKDYWTIEGLYIRSEDNATAALNFVATSAHSLTIKRCVFSHFNRYANGALARIETSGYLSMEECEGYYFHRAGFTLDGCTDARVTRCYLNSLAYIDVVGGTVSSPTTKGDEAFTIYNWSAGSSNYFENCISEGNGAGFLIMAMNTTANDRFLGCISIADNTGIYLNDNYNDHLTQPTATQVTHCVVISPNGAAYDLRSTASSVTLTNCTHIGSAAASGYSVDAAETLPTGASLVNCLAVDSGAGTNGVIVIDATVDTYSVNYCNAYGFTDNFNDHTKAEFTNITETDPALGAVRIYIPAASAMSGAGLAGADIGATVKYRYANGSLTASPLFFSAKFPKGAVITGLNDQAGTIYDVESRLGTLPTYAGTSGGIIGIIAQHVKQFTPFWSISNGKPRK